MKPLQQKILNLLSDGQFHSGEILGQQLNVTRSAIWKTLNQIPNLDIKIHSIKGKGYQIPGGIELLDLQKIQQGIKKEAQAHIPLIHIFNSIHSTNQYLLEQVRSAKSGTVCFAEKQTAGRGRRHRKWFSPFGANLYFSILWNFQKDPAEISGLSLAIGIAVIRALKKYGVQKNLGVKWPNDILWMGKKLAGVLLEMVAETHELTHVVIGIGLNVRMSENPTDIDQPWVDVEKIISHRPERNLLASYLLNELIHALLQFEKDNLIPFLDEWKQFDITKDKEVILHMPKENIEGKVIGLSEKGELLILDPHQKVHRFLSGEVSLRLR